MTRQPSENAPAQINIRYLYSFCGDIGAIRRFYTETLGMNEHAAHDDESFGWVNYECEGVALMFFRWTEAGMPTDRGWAWQPGDGAGQLPIMSFSVHVPEARYASVVGGVIASGAETLTDAPTWRQDSYWGLTVKDPAGNTVEVYTNPAERPESTTWPGE